MTAWHLDALDARGGLAFASFRGPDLGAETLDMDAPGVFVGAPDFRPETVASRGTGLAAARGSLQLGLFYDGTEVGFETLDDLVEFVRRCYIAGGGGDGAAGIGPGVPPRPEGPKGPEDRPPPRAEKLAEAEAWPIQQMLREFDQAARTTRLTKEGEAEGARYVASARDLGTPKPPTLPDMGELLELGAVTLVIELVGRCPSGNGDDLARWWQAVQCLGDAVGRLGLWHRIDPPGADAAIEQLGNDLMQRRSRLFPPPEMWPLVQRSGLAPPGWLPEGAAAVGHLLRGGANLVSRF